MSHNWKCNSCNQTFDDFKEIIEPDGLDTPPYRTSTVCPHCEQDDGFSEYVGTCETCGEDIYENDKYFKSDIDGINYFVYCKDHVTVTNANTNCFCDICEECIKNGEEIYIIDNLKHCQDCCESINH